ncbi:lysozyme [Paraburkholderia bannensis]|uniref:Lysozyme n=1 Tax=Paraburkholderia bannensis TaxID=765414 RepID=A0A7W9WUR0_9BURK|nr:MULTISPECIES: lysozyme [Paraburkholderia]MBB3259636.1 lysozyme [Paraburkholderia sp. WP4_3_2]MBB6104652.1 lysozyme [Paraburkholderia bannensis]
MPFRPQKKSLAAIVGAVVAAASISFTGGREGVSLEPYDDAIGGHVQTVCYGETNVPMRRYTLAECKQILGTSLAGYASGVRAMTPGFDQLADGQKVAVIDFAYNAGLENYRRSTLRRRYIARDFPGACDEFMKWRFAGGLDCSIAASHCAGIYNRRRADRAACLGE